MEIIQICKKESICADVTYMQVSLIAIGTVSVHQFGLVIHAAYIFVTKMDTLHIFLALFNV